MIASEESPAAGASVVVVPWHLSSSSAERLLGLDRDGLELDSLTETKDAPDSSTPQVIGSNEPDREIHGLPPVWVRIVTGKSFSWRIRRLRNTLCRRRRRTARAAVQWLKLHPDVRRSLALGRPVHLLKKRVLSRSSVFRPSIEKTRLSICADVETSLLSKSDTLITQVDVRSGSAMDPPAHVEVEPDGLIVCVAADGQRHTPMLPPIDLRTWSPVGFPQKRSTGTVRLDRVISTGSTRSLVRRMMSARGAGAIRCVLPDTVDPVSTARAITELGASGAPLTAGRIPLETRTLLPIELAALIESKGPSDLADARSRELHSINVRRITLGECSARGTWNRIGSRLGVSIDARPEISVLLPSNRPDDVLVAARQVAAQQKVRVQLVVGLHGTHMPAHLDQELAQAFPGDLVVERLPDSMNLGEVMNALTARAERALVSKWDDDDWYGVDHLTDLVLAREYSGAPLVAKAAEFVYLQSLDLTIRRFATGSERLSTTVAGGTLLLSLEDLRRVGWAPVPRQVDRRLIEAIEAIEAGRPACYRLHGFGYVLRRRGGEIAQHTWQVEDTYFLRQAVAQRSGLDLVFAGVESEPPE